MNSSHSQVLLAGTVLLWLSITLSLGMTTCFSSLQPLLHLSHFPDWYFLSGSWRHLFLEPPKEVIFKTSNSTSLWFSDYFQFKKTRLAFFFLWSHTWPSLLLSTPLHFLSLQFLDNQCLHPFLSIQLCVYFHHLLCTWYNYLVSRKQYK